MMLRQIQHFQTIVQENSFTEAAELCHISQSGISQSIKALEDEIGVKLITRKNRGFELTEAGEHFYKKSLVITADLEQLCRETVRIDRKNAAELSLGVLSTYSGDEFNRAIAAFSEKYSEVELSVTTGNHEDLYNGLHFGKIDIALNDQRRGVAGHLLDMAVIDLKGEGITPVYLVTDHTGFYERYGWQFLCMVQGDGDREMTRLYVHR